MAKPDNKSITYLGDGVYASFDGYQIWLEVGEGIRIALEPGVFSSLLEYAEKIWHIFPSTTTEKT